MDKRDENNVPMEKDLLTEITRLKKVVQDQKNEIEKLKRENSAWIPVSSGIFPRDKEIVQVTYLGFSDEKPCCEAFAFRKNGNWYWYSKGTRITVKITAWKPKCKAYEEKEMYDGIFKLAGLIKLMAEDVSKEDSWWKCEYIGPAIGLRETKNFWDEISVTDDSGYRSITLGDTKGQHIKGVHRYMLLYSENYNYADEKWKYPCFPSVEEIAERLQLVLEKVPLIPLELNNCDSEEFWYENRDEDSLQYFSDVVREYADKIAADPRTEEEIFSDIE